MQVRPVLPPLVKSFVSAAQHPEELPLAQHCDNSSGHDFVSDYELQLMSNLKQILTALSYYAMMCGSAPQLQSCVIECDMII